VIELQRNLLDSLYNLQFYLRAFRLHADALFGLQIQCELQTTGSNRKHVQGQLQTLRKRKFWRIRTRL